MATREIDLQSWPRRKHYELYRAMRYPYFSLCAEVTVGRTVAFAKANGIPVNSALVYVMANAANSIPQFRHRIRAGRVVEHEVIHPSFTVPLAALASTVPLAGTAPGEGGDELFNFCTVEYAPGAREFLAACERRRREAESARELTLDEPGRDDYLFITSIPWIAFTAITHPVFLDQDDSIPRVAWGKFTGTGESRKTVLNIQLHHALADGLHAGRFYQRVERLLADPESVYS